MLLYASVSLETTTVHYAKLLPVRQGTPVCHHCFPDAKSVAQI